MSKNIFWKHCA